MLFSRKKDSSKKGFIVLSNVVLVSLLLLLVTTAEAGLPWNYKSISIDCTSGIPNPGGRSEMKVVWGDFSYSVTGDAVGWLYKLNGSTWVFKDYDDHSSSGTSGSAIAVTIKIEPGAAYWRGSGSAKLSGENWTHLNSGSKWCS
jgi:hypothetical protein